MSLMGQGSPRQEKSQIGNETEKQVYSAKYEVNFITLLMHIERV